MFGAYLLRLGSTVCNGDELGLGYESVNLEDGLQEDTNDKIGHSSV